MFITQMSNTDLMPASALPRVVAYAIRVPSGETTGWSEFSVDDDGISMRGDASPGPMIQISELPSGAGSREKTTTGARRRALVGTASPVGVAAGGGNPPWPAALEAGAAPTPMAGALGGTVVG